MQQNSFESLLHIKLRALLVLFKSKFPSAIIKLESQWNESEIALKG